MTRSSQASISSQLAHALKSLADVQLELDAERLDSAATTALLDEMLAAMTEPLLLTDAPGRVTRVNRAAERLFGPIAAATPLAEIFGSDFPDSPWAIIESGEGGTVRDLEHRVEDLDGTSRRMLVNASVLRDEHGLAVGALYVLRDLTETHRLVDRLSASERRWRLLASTSAVLSGGTTLTEALTDVCSLVADDAGIDCAVALIEDGRIVSAVGDGPGSELLSGLVSADGRPSGILARALRDGQIIHAASVTATMDLGPAGHRPIGALVVAPVPAGGTVSALLVLTGAATASIAEDDVELAEVLAARIALSMENRALHDALVEVETVRRELRFRRDVAAAVSHDMKTPLAALVAGLEATRTITDQSRRLQALDSARRQTARLQRLVQQFVDFAQLEAGHGVTVSPRRVRIDPIVDEVVELVHRTGPIEVIAAGPGAQVWADPDRLHQILANLLSNADKFAPQGSTIRLETTLSAAEVRIEVTDEGGGIDAVDAATMFEPFKRGRRASNIPGTGLGLYIAKALTEAQDGRIEVATPAGGGAAFAIVLKAACPELAAPTESP